MGVKLIPVFLVIFGLLGAAFGTTTILNKEFHFTENNAKLQAVTETQKATISSLEASAAATAANISDLKQNFKLLKRQVEKLQAY